MNAKTRFENRITLRSDTIAVTGSLACLLLLPLAGWSGGVVTECTEASLRAAMTGGGVVTFACDGTITLTVTITNEADAVLDATGHAVTISGGNSVRVFFVPTNVTLAAVNLSIANGLSSKGGGLYNDGGLVTVSNCVFSGNRAVGPAGTGNGGSGSAAAGGAIYNQGVLQAVACAFVKNSANGGAGSSAQPAGLSYVPGGGGGGASGGAIFNLGTIFIDRSLFAGNTAVGGLGGNGSSGNPGYLGPPYWGTPGGDGGDAWGAALFMGSGSALVNCTLSGNQTQGGAGGQGGNGGYQINMGTGEYIYFDGGSGGNGGSGLAALYDFTGSTQLTNTTIASNFNAGGPGGSHGRHGNGGSGGGPAPDGSVAGALATTNSLLVNTLLAGNFPSNCTGRIADAGHNLSSDASCEFTNSGSLNNTDPKLGPLANNGGPTLTMALLPGSPAIDAGDNAAAPATDQRGIPRPVGSFSDIGAYEFTAVLQIGLAPNGGINVLVYGPTNQACRLLTSTNLSGWYCVATNQIGPNGTVLFPANGSVAEPQRFYQAALP